MITSTLKSCLETAGCTLVLYEASQLANLLTDQSRQDDIIGLVLQPTEITLEVKATGIHEHYPPIRVEIMQQVRLEDSAENNELVLDSLLEISKLFIRALIATEEFHKINSFTISKILENKYDANLIGWSLPLDLKLIENKPC